MQQGEPDPSRPHARLDVGAPTLTLAELHVQDVRNIGTLELSPSPRLNVISGSNGQGKTSLLEAIYALATCRSFRTAKLPELTRAASEGAWIRGRFVEHPGGDLELSRTQLFALQGGRSSLRLDGRRPSSLVDYATRSPVIVFHPGELQLTSGPSEHRRLLLDRVALFAEPTSGVHRARYLQALRARQRLLREQGASASPEALRAFEQLCAEHGSALTRARRRAVEALSPAVVEAFERIAAPGLRLELTYQPGGAEEPEACAQQLQQARGRDAFRQSAGHGPHRDELALRLQGQPARTTASQGQHRALTLALKIAETRCIARSRGLDPIVLLDDVSSELDADRTLALLDYLASSRGQLFLTTTRPELIQASTPGVDERAGRRHDYRMEAGSIRSL